MIGEAVQQQETVPRQAGPHGELPNRSSPPDAEEISTLAVGLAVQLHCAEQKNDRLQEDFDELAEDYNSLVIDTLQQGADRFESKTQTEPARRCASAEAATGPVAFIGPQRTAGGIKPRRT
ncbi:hypothetical protein [Streptomyces kronopolitis]|uniref:hypothetical protein n=1 Tax=Streptomyces kronopolitis TaxID=1612435 RepID=UPI003D95DD16